MAEENDAKSGGGGSSTKILLFVLVPLLVIGSVFVGLYFGGAFNDSPADEEDDEEQIEEAHNAPAVYIPLDPAFVVNFSSGGRARFLQITLELMTRDITVPDMVKLHMPAIRNNLVLLFSNQTYDGVNSLDGKEALRTEALQVVQDVLEQETDDPGVEAIYFTSFVMQ